MVIVSTNSCLTLTYLNTCFPSSFRKMTWISLLLHIGEKHSWYSWEKYQFYIFSCPPTVYNSIKKLVDIKYSPYPSPPHSIACLCNIVLTYPFWNMIMNVLSHGSIHNHSVMLIICIYELTINHFLVQKY